ncbi:MAG TPA: AI-2E family transporter [Acidobacteriaceae bacterium]|nr:AI-2E family transporter [Acidobacteriaceae bacterium]
MSISGSLPEPGSRREAYVESSRTRSMRSNILFAFAIAIALALAYLMREILLLLYVSALAAVVLTPVIRGIMRLHIRDWHPGRGLAIAILLFAVFSSTGLFLAFAIPPVAHDMRSFTKELPTRGPELLERVKQLPLASHLNVESLNAKVQGFASNFAEYVLLSISDWATKVADIATALVLAVYFMLEGDIAYRWILSFFPVDIRERLDRTLMRADARMGKWLLGQGILMLTLGISSTIVFLSLKIRYASALGVLMGVLNIVPVVGGMASMALVLFVAAIDSWGKVLGALIFYVIYVQFENSYLTPKVMKSSVDLAGLAVLVSLLMGSKIAGVVGAMIAVPTAVLIAVLIQEYLVKDEPLTPVAQSST